MGSKSGTSSLITRNLNEVFAENKQLKKEWFVKSRNFKSMVAVVPNDVLPKWLSGYEFLNDFIVPQSDLEYPITGDLGGYTLRRIVFLERETDHTIQEAKHKFGVTLRDFYYDPELSRQAETDRLQAQSQSNNDIEQLGKACLESFKDIYSTLVHIKVK
jgi:V-ATPase subunit C